MMDMYDKRSRSAQKKNSDFVPGFFFEVRCPSPPTDEYGSEDFFGNTMSGQSNGGKLSPGKSEKTSYY